jgi:hypothetical protein
MGRGLSDLQRYILARAATVPRLHYVDILAEYFGWERGGWDTNGHSGQHFSRRRIGEKRYGKTMATLSRSVFRLQDRGLVVWMTGWAKWSAAEITDKGREWLSVNKVPRWYFVNR